MDRETNVADRGAVRLRLRLPDLPERAAWQGLRTEFVVTVVDTLTMTLISSNESAVPLELENCLHSYFRVGDIHQIALTGLQDAAYLDNAAGGNGERKVQHDAALRITDETNRIYTDHSGTVKIIDPVLGRCICVEKTNSTSTVVWNPWTTQKLPDDFDVAEHRYMVCVESANLKHNRITLMPGQTTSLNVVLSSSMIET